MTQDLIYCLSGLGLFGIGLYGLILPSSLLRKILAINIMGIGVFMQLVATAYRIPTESETPVPDPVPHAMVLTGIVIAVAGTALALSLICRIYQLRSSSEKETKP